MAQSYHSHGTILVEAENGLFVRVRRSLEQ
jgi:hypothetical protein